MPNFTQIKEDIQTMTKSEKCILISIVCMFINTYLLIAFAMIVLISEFLKGNLVAEIKEQPGYKVLYLFATLGLVVAIVHQNMTGAVNSIGFIILFLYMAYYRKHISSKLIYYVIETIIIGSIFMNIYGLFQFKYLSNLSGYSFFDFKVQNSPSKRITGTYWNANFYAMMIEFTIVLCMLRFVQNKKFSLKIWYVVIGLFNIVLMYLTGCRAAFMPFVLFVPLFLYISKEKKWCLASVLCIVAFVAAFYFFPNLIPRSSDVSTVNSRVEIWTCAIHGIKDYPLFGQGFQAYQLIYPIYDGHKATHAHNIYLDVLINFGIVGTLLLIRYSIYIAKDVLSLRHWKDHPEYFGIALSFAIILLIHGTMDCTINMPSTAFVFLLIMNMNALKENIVLKDNYD